MAEKVVADAALRNLHEKLELLEQKAVYAKELMDKAAYLAVVKSEGDPSDVQGDLDKQSNSTEQDLDSKYNEFELLQQKEELLHALIGCISDLENLGSGDISAESTNTPAIRELDQEVLKHGLLINKLTSNASANVSPDAAFAQKIEVAQDVLSQLNAENVTFEKTLAGLEAMLNEKLVFSNSVGSTAESEKTESVIVSEARKEDVVSTAPNDADLFATLQNQIGELQATLQQLDSAIERETDPNSK